MSSTGTPEDISLYSDEKVLAIARDPEFTYWMSVLVRERERLDPEAAIDLWEDMWTLVANQYDAGPELRKPAFAVARDALYRQERGRGET